MNFSNPILICDENEEFRILIRDMLTRNGFFHVVEASNTDEAIEYLKIKNEYFVLISANALTNDSLQLLADQKSFLVLADNSNPKTIFLASKLGVDKIVSHPIHTRKLMNKINSSI
jgi:DNA-binding NarL/FixJ family response regulator